MFFYRTKSVVSGLLAKEFFSVKTPPKTDPILALPLTLLIAFDISKWISLKTLPYGYTNSNLCIFSLVSAFRRKTRLIKWASVSVCVCVCVCVCVSVSVYSFGPPLTISIPVMQLIRNFGYI